MRFEKKLSYCILLLTILNSVSHAEHFRFSHITIENGLSQSSVYCMMQDSKGFLWFGTRDGLNRYDGYEFKVFRTDPENENSLSNNWIWDIFEDKERNIWVATWYGLTKYDPQNNSFTRFLPDSTNSHSISGNRPASICQDKNGFIWIATWGGGLNRYDPESNLFTAFLHDPENKNSIPGNFVRKLLYDSKGRLWIGTWQGIALGIFHPDGSISFHRFVHEKNNTKSISCNQTMAILEDHSGQIWIATRDGGLNLFSESDSTFIHYKHNDLYPNSLSSNEVSTLYEDSKHRLWVGTFSNGLNLFDRKKGTFIRITEDPDDPGSLLNNNVYSILEDNSGLLWIGAGGLNIFNPAEKEFGMHKHDKKNKNSLSNNNVSGFYEDGSGKIWISTYGGGLNCFDPENNQFTVYKHDPSNPNSIRSNVINTISGNGNGTIWIATNEGLDTFDPKIKRFRHTGFIPGLTNQAGLRYINFLSFSSKNTLWMATENIGLVHYDLTTRTAICFNTYGKGNRHFRANALLSLFHGSNNNLWIGTWGTGICAMDLKTMHFKEYLVSDKDSALLEGNIIHVIYETKKDTDQIIWAGTNNGVLCLDPKRNKLEFITTKEGLPSNIIFGILCDNAGNMWFSSNKGLSMYDPKTHNIRNFDVSDGLQSNEFSDHVSLKLKDGRLLFGGMNGFNLFNPSRLRECTFQPPIVLTSFKIFNKEQLVNKDLQSTKKIELTHNQNFFSFEFASLDYANPSKIKYMYRMKGVDKNWINSGNRRYVSYTNVTPGNYVFQVRGTNRDGIFSKNALSVRIVILPPWWQTWWFRSLVVIAVILLFYALHRLRVQKLLAIEKLRIRIASDLHDDVGSALTRISITSEQIQTLNDHNRIQNLSKNIGTMSRDIISTMSDIVWSIDSRNDNLSELLDRMQDHAYKNLVMNEIKVSLKTSGMDKSKKIKIDHRQNIFYIFKETINNIVKHSNATEVKIILKNEGKEFFMEIADNGTGFSAEKFKKGNGLRNMQMRAKRMNAKLDISNNNGVKVSLRMNRL